MLMLALAEYANEEGVAWPGLERLAGDILQDKRTVQRLAQQLHREGWIEVCPRTAPVRMADGRYENRGTSYRINLAKLRGVSPTRQDERPAAGAQVRRSGAVEDARRDDKPADPRRQNEHAEATKSTPRDDISRAPLITSQEPPKNHQERPTPDPLSFGAGRGKTGNGKYADQEQERKATASAKATATTPELRAAMASRERGGEAGMSSGARPAGKVIAFRRRDPRAGLSDADQLLFDIAMDVLGECGVAAKNATRRQIAAVSVALDDEVARTGEALPLVAARAIARWDEYIQAHAKGLLFRVVGVRLFFGEGYWLEDAGRPWDWDKTAIRQRRNGMIGTR